METRIDAGAPLARPGLLRRALRRSPWVFHVGTSGCNNCDIEIADCLTPRFDVERFGVRLVGSPRHADLLLVTGPVSRDCREPLMRVLLEVPEPRGVVLVGTCPCSMGVYRDAYSVAGPADRVLREVDPAVKLVYVPGCPPKPEAIVLGIVKLLGRL